MYDIKDIITPMKSWHVLRIKIKGFMILMFNHAFTLSSFINKAVFFISDRSCKAKVTFEQRRKMWRNFFWYQSGNHWSTCYNKLLFFLTFFKEILFLRIQRKHVPNLAEGIGLFSEQILEIDTFFVVIFFLSFHNVSSSVGYFYINPFSFNSLLCI